MFRIAVAHPLIIRVVGIIRHCEHDPQSLGLEMLSQAQHDGGAERERPWYELALVLFREFLVQFEEFGYAVGFGHCTPVEAISVHYGLVVFLMGLAEFGRHCQFVIEVGKGAVGIFGTGIEDGLGCLLDSGFLGLGRCRPREVVVDDIL